MKQVLDVLLDTDSEIGIAVLDPQLRVLFMNEKMNTLYPAKEGEVYAEKTRFHQLIQLAVRQNKKIAGFPVHEFIESQPVHVMLYILPFRQDGTIVSLFVLACDMTEIHKSYESKIRQKEIRIIGNMAAGSADVILNPLAVIRGTLQLMEQSIKNDVISIKLSTHPLKDKLDQYFSLAYQQVHQIDDVLQRFLLLGKPSEMAFVPISVFAFLQKFIPCIQRKAFEQNVALVCEFPSSDGQIVAQEFYLQELMSALFLNAFEASQPGGTVKFRTEIQNKTINFFIEDQGEGIADYIIQQVKEPFFTTKDGALGIGLNYCEGILHKIGGTLYIQSSANGTQVHVVLPKII